MKGIRFLLFVMAICLASGVNAQFYDSADDIYYYVQEFHEYEKMVQVGPYMRWEKTGEIIKESIDENKASVFIFNFDGMKASELSGNYGGTKTYSVKENIKKNPFYYEERIEVSDYNWKYVSSSYSGVIYKDPNTNNYTYLFSPDRKTLKVSLNNTNTIDTYKRVNKSFFKVGRSRTPSNTLHE